MRIILQEKVTNLGNIGDLVTVKAGYARNYLIPGGKAMQANEENIKAFESQRADLEKKETARLQEAKARAEKLAAMTVNLTAKASEEGKMFGSISGREIAAEATSSGVELNKSEVEMPEGPIRVTGEYEVHVHLHAEVTGTLKVVVTAEK